MAKTKTEGPIENFAPADDVFEALESVPGINDNRPQRRAARAQMGRTHRIGLAMIRKAAELTQTEVAETLGVRQATVSRIETRPDMLLSTLRHYLDAAGAERPRIIVTIAGVDYEVDLDAFG